MIDQQRGDLIGIVGQAEVDGDAPTTVFPG
jgi:hypothetical protein